MTALGIGPSRSSASCFIRSQHEGAEHLGRHVEDRGFAPAGRSAHVALEAFGKNIGIDDRALAGLAANDHVIVVEENGAGRQQIAHAIGHRDRTARRIDVGQHGESGAQVDAPAAVGG